MVLTLDYEVKRSEIAVFIHSVYGVIYSLQELMALCRQGGAVLFDPHVLTVEDGGLGVIDAQQVGCKLSFDPRGLLNPGKLRGWWEQG